MMSLRIISLHQFIAIMSDSETPFFKFQNGDVVRLKSGGPNMTVHDNYSHQVESHFARNLGSVVMCTWFLDNGTRMKDKFMVDSLDLVTDDASTD